MSLNMAAFPFEESLQTSARRDGWTDGFQESVSHSVAKGAGMGRGNRFQALHPDVPVFDCNPPRIHSAHMPWDPRRSGVQSLPQYPQIPNMQPSCYVPSMIGCVPAGPHIPFGMRPLPPMPIMPVAYTFMPEVFCPYNVESLHRQHAPPRPSDWQHGRGRCPPPQSAGLGQHWSSVPGSQGTRSRDGGFRDGGFPRGGRRGRARGSRRPLAAGYLHCTGRGFEGGLRVKLPESTHPADSQSDSDESPSLVSGPTVHVVCLPL